VRTTDRVRTARSSLLAALVVAGLFASACQPAPLSVAVPTKNPGPPATTKPPRPPTTTTTTPPGTGLTLKDTGYTRVRVVLENQAAWVDVALRGTTIKASRVVSTSGGLWISALGGDRVAAWGQGTAVVDLVLQIAPAAAPSLYMCKNYLGPATVTVRRLTDGDTVVGALTNDGASTLVLPGSCENPASASVSRSALIGPVRWPARRDPRPLVLANYYPWFDAQTLAGPFQDPPIGPADTSQPSQVTAAVDLARTSGVDGFVVEYEGTVAHEPKIDLVFDAADARPGFQMALMVDFAILHARPLGLSPEGLDRALDEVASHAGRRSQLEVDGRPVMFVYDAARVDPTAWSDALGRLYTRTGLRPFVVADKGVLGAPGRYDYGTNHLATPAQLASWADGRVQELQLGPGLGGGSGPLWVAPVSPGYDDRALGRPQPLYVPRNGGIRYEQSWDAALRSLPDWILVTSWNEYYENTHVMPGAVTGQLALSQTKPRQDTFRRTG
jgi:hypothetical protein